MKALGCVAEGEAKALERAVLEWGAQIQALGPDPRTINARSSYAGLLRNIVWDYLDSPKVCGSVRTACYRRLYQPLDKLFSLFREKDLRSRLVLREVAELVTQMNESVRDLRAQGQRPPCEIVRASAPAAVASDQTGETSHATSERAPASAASAPSRSSRAEEREAHGAEPVVATPVPRTDAPPAARSERSRSDEFLVQNLGDAGVLLKHAGADPKGVDKALAYFAAHESEFPNRRYVSFIDFTKPAFDWTGRGRDKRLFVLDRETGKVERVQVSHGQNSGSRGGVPTKFSNDDGTLMSSLGAYRVGTVSNDAGRAQRKYRIYLDGLESTNDAARDRGIYMHEGVNYDSGKAVNYTRSGGRSHGCPALNPEDLLRLQGKIGGGSFLYIYSDRASR